MTSYEMLCTAGRSSWGGVGWVEKQTPPPQTQQGGRCIASTERLSTEGVWKFLYLNLSNRRKVPRIGSDDL